MACLLPLFFFLRMWTSPEWWMSWCPVQKPLICRGWLWPGLCVGEKTWSEWILRISSHFAHFMSFWEVTEMRMFFKHRPCFCYQVLLWANHLLLKFWVIQGARKKEKAIIPAESANHISCKSCFQWDKIENAAALKFSGSFTPKFRHCSISSIYVMIFQVHLLKQKDTWQVRLRASSICFGSLVIFTVGISWFDRSNPWGKVRLAAGAQVWLFAM